MRILKGAVAALLLSAGLGVGTAAPASAATPQCTSWTTYWAPFSTTTVTHVPTAGYQTGNQNCELKIGAHNDAVTVLQRGLKYCHGYNIGVDGEYGPQTRGAVLDLQQWANGAFNAGLEEDGEWGPHTRDWTQFPDWTWPANVRTNRCDHAP
ncbi:MAG TPA: peptidoglycan-binding domain-containing protein [Mycobacteriales bacterium]|nr:peptidoglycan-binding domain-containing protein [Mycobacteriales bacterium]